MKRHAAIAVAGFLGIPCLGGLAGGDEDACTIATKGDSPVAKACAAGGRGAAKKKMKALVGAANKAGGDYKCGRCHADMKNYKLKDNARDDFKKLLEASK
jgi:hypothetical protein